MIRPYTTIWYQKWNGIKFSFKTFHASLWMFHFERICRRGNMFLWEFLRFYGKLSTIASFMYCIQYVQSYLKKQIDSPWFGEVFKQWKGRGNYFHSAQCSEGVTKPPWLSKQIEVNLSFLEAFGNILSRKLFLNILKVWITPLNQLQK